MEAPKPCVSRSIARSSSRGSAPLRPFRERLFADSRVAELERTNIPSGQPAAPRSDAGAALVTIKNFTYGATELTVRTGTRVTFVNDDAEAHTVTSVTRAFDSGAIGQDRQWSRLGTIVVRGER